MNTAERRLGLRPARAICVWVPSPQSNNSHSASRATASALTLRFRVGLPELVPRGITLIGVYNNTPKADVQSSAFQPERSSQGGRPDKQVLRNTVTSYTASDRLSRYDDF